MSRINAHFFIDAANREVEVTATGMTTTMNGRSRAEYGVQFHREDADGRSYTLQTANIHVPLSEARSRKALVAWWNRRYAAAAA
ncbi:hypothetical protein ACFOYU_09945 [Microvirga sp. GCM10011540]|uniref:hypothetical protein n=1 Tax=Microvirga sp. GCM10011540 TaxID=3317338 RepID=UPI0036137881